MRTDRHFGVLCGLRAPGLGALSSVKPPQGHPASLHIDALPVLLSPILAWGISVLVNLGALSPAMNPWNSLGSLHPALCGHPMPWSSLWWCWQLVPGTSLRSSGGHGWFVSLLLRVWKCTSFFPFSLDLPQNWSPSWLKRKDLCIQLLRWMRFQIPQRCCFGKAYGITGSYLKVHHSCVFLSWDFHHVTPLSFIFIHSFCKYSHGSSVQSTAATLPQCEVLKIPIAHWGLELGG